MKTNPAYQNIGCVDVSISAGGPVEDKIYALNPHLEKSIRRGNTYIDVYDTYDHNLHKYVGIARKGLMKFYDLKLEYLNSDEEFKHIIKAETHDKNSALMESNLRNYIFGGIVRSLNEGAYVEVIKTLKVNGENAQISWIKEESLWCIASKNVGILANNPNDLKYYDNTPGSRYAYAVSIAHAWFKIINRLRKNQKSIADLQQKLAGKTLVGEYVGNSYLQHIVKYSKETIIFYCITDNNSDET